MSQDNTDLSTTLTAEELHDGAYKPMSPVYYVLEAIYVGPTWTGGSPLPCGEQKRDMTAQDGIWDYPDTTSGSMVLKSFASGRLMM